MLWKNFIQLVRNICSGRSLTYDGCVIWRSLAIKKQPDTVDVIALSCDVQWSQAILGLHRHSRASVKKKLHY